MKFEISLNGRTYEVEVELAKPMTNAEFAAYAPAPAAAPAVSAPAAPAAAAAAPAAVGAGEQVTAPMPGNILKVNVNVGDRVTEGVGMVVIFAIISVIIGATLLINFLFSE